jgi:hypothetical protein
MEYFAGLDVSMAETHVCVVTGNGRVIHNAKVPSTPTDIAAELAQVPACRRVVFETGRGSVTGATRPGCQSAILRMVSANTPPPSTPIEGQRRTS